MWKCIATVLDSNQLPANNNHEVAFWGRSNVGKSSLINALANQKIAYVSRTPGKTKTINFFETSNRQFVVDLPGYGYSKASKVTKKIINNSVVEYITTRKQLKFLFLLIDSFVGYTTLDMTIIDFLQKSQKNFHILLTKTDRINQKQLYQIKAKTKLLGFETNSTLISSRKKRGVDAVKSIINQILPKVLLQW